GVDPIAPVPERSTACGLPLASLLMFSAPVRAPVAVGLKARLIVQLTPAASVAGELVGQLPPARAKSPLTDMLLSVRVVPPEFVSVTLWALLVVPICWLPKLR